MAYIIAVILNIILSVIEYSVIIECVCSWLPQVMGTKFYEAITRFNAPFLNPIRKLIYNFSSGVSIDFSPIILVIIIGMIRRII